MVLNKPKQIVLAIQGDANRQLLMGQVLELRRVIDLVFESGFED